MKKFMSLMLLVCACLLSQPVKAQQVTPDNAGYIVKVGDMAPDFEMELTDGQKVKLSDLRGEGSDASVHCQLVWSLPKGDAFY